MSAQQSSERNCILINGTMGIGKTTVCKELTQLLPQSVFLDGDWCWFSHPFTVTNATKQMVLENISFLLRNFLRCPDYCNIIFCWVMDQPAILDEVTARIRPALGKTALHCITLTADEQTLIRRLSQDIGAGIRSSDILKRSLARLPLYEHLSTQKLDTSHLTPRQAAQQIAEIIKNP